MSSAVLDQYCGSVFWNASYLDRPDPDLPVCVEQTVLVWIPLGFLWLSSTWNLVALCKNKAPARNLSKLYLSKQILAGLLFLTSVAGLAVTLGEDFGPNSDSETSGRNATVFYANPVLFAVSWILVMLRHENIRRKPMAVDSGSLFLFWLLQVLCGIFPFQTVLRKALTEEGISDLPRVCLFYIGYGLQLISFVLCGIADVPPEAQDVAKKNPEAGAAWFSRITFNWFNSMVFKGYKKPLVQEDLWDLNEKEGTRNILDMFELVMVKELAKARVRFQKELRKWKAKQREEPHANGLAKGVSQDVLVMEERGSSKDKKKKKEKKKKEEETPHPNSWLIPSIGKAFKWMLIESAVFKLLYDLLAFVSPQLLKLMITFTEDRSIYLWKGYVYAILLLLAAVVQSLFLQQYFQRCFVLGMKVRTALMAAVYKKALIVSNDTRQESTVGETVNLMSADAQRFNDVTNFVHLIWSCPLQIGLSIYFLWLEMGPSVLAGLAVMVIMAPINLVLATKSRDLQAENMKLKDKRMKIMNEILNGMKILKLYAWEASFEAQILTLRELELKRMKKIAYYSSISTFIFSAAPAIVSLATFAVYVSVSPDNILDAEKAFTSISLFNILRFPLAMLPMLIGAMVQISVSKKRLEKFLGGEDLDSNAVTRDPSSSSAISVKDGAFSWGKDNDVTLKDVSLDIKPGRLVAVVGAVGSGKSSLLSALLGEMHNNKGSINMLGSVAYVPQQAWIQNATLRDNILFGSELEGRRYEDVLDACALKPDLELLPGGDETEIGEKGINLSGGQKQRVSLARATYSGADTYLLDDPLSAVDSHVAKHLFERVIGPKGLLRDKTRILVTHGVSFLPHVDQVVVLTDGRVSEVGSYESLKASGGAFSEFLFTYAKEENNKTDKEEASDTEELDLTPEAEDVQADGPPEDVVTTTLRRNSSIRGSQRHAQRNGSVKLRKSSSVRSKRISDESKKGQRLIEKEAMETGTVKFSVYLQYLRAMGWGYTALVFLMYFIQNVAFIGSNLWLSEWTTDSVTYFNQTYPNNVRDMRVGVFGALGVAQGFFIFLGTLLLADGAIAASRLLHSSLLGNVLRVPMMFFDTTPSGRVVNRFAKDMLTVDEMIPMSFRSWMLCLLGVIGTLFVICLATPIFIAVVVPLAVVYYFVQRFYVATSRQLRRLDSVSRSPIYSHFGETVAGLSVIRAYGHQERFLMHNEKTMDENLKSVYPWIVSNRWLAIRLEFLGNLVVFFSALFAVISRENLSSGLVGLSISYALNVTQTLNWLVRMTSELETNIVAVERVNEYTEIKNEAAWITDKRPDQSWPESGKIRFEDFKVRYRPELDLVLHGITCDIDTTEKIGIVGCTGAGKSGLVCASGVELTFFPHQSLWQIGIVGRTGAGKSSLTNCLFRIIEAAEGKILIDGIDIAAIGLHDLRSRLTIIPQDPVLFSGSLRMNLDPFEKFSDEDLWRALELSHLKEFAKGLPEGLQYEVSEGGENLSVGQRQLLCLARALLRKSRILILDEATAAVDLETDDLIQTTIRKEFSDCTVLTIAHRLNTILDSSRIMVLDAGKIVEFDTPSALFKKQGHFFSMAKDAGITTDEYSAL